MTSVTAGWLATGLLLVAVAPARAEDWPQWRGGFVYVLDKRDGLKCIELKTGAVKWEGEHVTPPARNPHASPVWAGDRALILNARGELVMARLSPAEKRFPGRRFLPQ